MDQFRQQFQSQLKELQFPHKAQINFLTMLADENITFCQVIIEGTIILLTKEICSYIKHSQFKVSGFYLLDSILKNLGKKYLPEAQLQLPVLFEALQIPPPELPKVIRVLETWKEKPLFPLKFIDGLQAKLNGNKNITVSAKSYRPPILVPGGLKNIRPLAIPLIPPASNISSSMVC